MKSSLQMKHNFRDRHVGESRAVSLIIADANKVPRAPGYGAELLLVW